MATPASISIRQVWRRVTRVPWARLSYPLVWLTGVLVGAFFLSFLSAGEIYDFQDSVDGVHLPRVDAIVCLAGGRGRISTAGDLWIRYRESSSASPVLYVAGMGPHATWRTLAQQLRRGVQDVLRPGDVFLETESSNTVENARMALFHARQRGWKNLLVVTSRYHMKRAWLVFSTVFQGSGIALESLSVYQEPFEPGEWRSDLQGVKVTLFEYLKWLFLRATLTASRE